ncbi:acyltransferase [Vibrio sp. B1Z05]|uniref:acyltransferase n=1 Tax=Vibrio sp. B1Z05 TaxID=2654980 RepID=UPI00128D8ECF|nr:acyltransferase [Vibrio sp. B1Z05]MPW36244.1 acyltransferase [Vibrio sp. B1Z05]
MHINFKIFRKLKKIMWKYYYTRKALKSLKEYDGLPHVNKRSTFNKNTHLGSNCHFNGIDILGRGKVRIGNNFHSGPDCMMITENHNINGTALPYDHSSVIKNIDIGDNVWVGCKVIILGGVKIGEGVVIQAGSVVVSDIPALSIAGGHPAKVFSKRDSVHYYALKNQNKFC